MTGQEHPKADFVESLTGMPFIFVQGGAFAMGDTFGDGFDNERPVHEVTVDDFFLGQFPVTQGEWRTIMGENPAHFKLSDRHPVEMVSWHDIQSFITRLNERSDATFRLPTEAEWEFAARSRGRREKWAGTSDPQRVTDYGWYDRNSDLAGDPAKITSQPVGLKQPNGLGLYDMSGNVYELVQDVYGEEAYRHHAPRNPLHPGPGSDRVLRGGSWYGYYTLLRCTDRSIYGAHHRDRYVGFRLLRQA